MRSSCARRRRRPRGGKKLQLRLGQRLRRSGWRLPAKRKRTRQSAPRNWRGSPRSNGSEKPNSRSARQLGGKNRRRPEWLLSAPDQLRDGSRWVHRHASNPEGGATANASESSSEPVAHRPATVPLRATGGNATLGGRDPAETSVRARTARQFGVAMTDPRAVTLIVMIEEVRTARRSAVAMTGRPVNEAARIDHLGATMAGIVGSVAVLSLLVSPVAGGTLLQPGVATMMAGSRLRHDDRQQVGVGRFRQSRRAALALSTDYRVPKLRFDVLLKWKHNGPPV